MYLCILDRNGQIVLHHNMASAPEPFLQAIAPYRGNLVVGVECIFCWYWLADLCAAEKIKFVLGHALYMKAIHGGKAKNDKIDAYKIASLLRGDHHAPRQAARRRGLLSPALGARDRQDPRARHPL